MNAALYVCYVLITKFTSMKKLIAAAYAALLMITASAQNLKHVAQKIKSLHDQEVQFTGNSLFEITAGTRMRSSDIKGEVSRATILNLRQSNMQAILAERPAHILISIPLNSGNTFELELYQSEIFTPDFSVVESSSNQAVSYTGGLHYWGIVKNNNRSLAAISIFENEVMGLISLPDEGNFVLGKLEGDAGNAHILYNENDLSARKSLQCFNTGDDKAYNPKELQCPSKLIANCIRLYWEVNYDIYQGKGSVANATNYVTGLFNESALIYANDNIPVALSQVYVWNTTSPYTSTSSSGLLSQFQAYRNSFNGDLGHLLGYSGGGGIAAGFSGLCAANLDNSQCYSGIHSSYSNVPTYSWSVEVVTHEQGHLMGSRHTHACVWNGNGTAIDGCGPSAGYGYEGSCSGAPLPPAGGTIMSYCHLAGVGINFTLGFGAQPAAVILNNYNNATCLINCNGTICLSPVNMNTLNITTTTATLTWDTVPGAVSYVVQYRVAGSGSWIPGTSSINSYNAVGLTPGTNYEWQVQTVCSGGSSIYTVSSFFTTVPAVCNIPSGLYTINITSNSAVLTWVAVGGASCYNIQWRAVGSPSWQTGTTTSTSYTISGLTPVTNYEWQIQTVCVGGAMSSISNSVNFGTLALGQAVTIILQPDAECGKDAWLSGCFSCGQDTVNFGTMAEFDACGWTVSGQTANVRSVIEFDLTSIPAGSTVQSAYLSLYFNPNSSNGNQTQFGLNDAYLSKVTSPWFENTVTWVNQPATTPVNQTYLPVSTTSTQDYLNLDVTAMTQDFVNNPSANYGMMLKLINEATYRCLLFASSDHFNAALRPKLEVTYLPAITTCVSYQYSNCNGIDALVSGCVPCGYDTSNFGDAPEFDAIAWTNGGNISNCRGLIYWDLSSIPVTAVVTSATLSLYGYNSPANGHHDPLTGANDAYINKVIGPWSENVVTWNTKPSVSPVNQAYLTASTTPTQDYTNIDVTAMVQDMIVNPSGNYGMMLQLVTESFYRKLVFASSDNADPAKHPRLDICFTAPVAVNEIDDENSLIVTQDIFSGNVKVISGHNFKNDASIALYNSAGQMVMKYNNLSGRIFMFSNPIVADGIYFYRVINGNKILNGKLLMISKK